jgi:uncharacterized protein YbjT (DUF2867 family)
MPLKLAFIGATGSLGKPVAIAMVNAGFEVTALVRNEEAARKQLPASVKLITGDMKNPDDLRKFLHGQEALHLNLSIRQNESEPEWHTESHGLKLLIPLAADAGVQRISYLSALVMRYQGMNEFDWWVLKVKLEAARMIKDSGLHYTIFYPSTFMEAIPGQYKLGSRMVVSGESKFKQHFIAAADYAQQVVASYRKPDGNKEYVVQGPEAFTTDEAIAVFMKNYSKGKLSLTKAPPGLIRFLAKYSQKMNYGWHIIEALNNYPEKFEAEKTWNELGKPATTLEKFAASV